MAEQYVKSRVSWAVIGGFAIWALLRRLIEMGLSGAMFGKPFAAVCLIDGLGAVGLLGWCLSRGQSLPALRAWVALLLPVAAELSTGVLQRTAIGVVLHLHAARPAQQELIFMAGPLWLALLGAVRWLPEATPRRTVGAAIAGIGSMALLLPEQELSPALAAVPVLLLTMLQASAVVWTWSYAKRSLAGVPVAMVAGCGLLIAAMSNGLLSMAAEQSPWQTMAWRSVAGSLACAAAATIAAALLWYWLLQRMELAAFAMQEQAYWLAGILLQLTLFGSLDWRVGTAVALELGALAVALRARPEDDDPVLLHVV